MPAHRHDPSGPGADNLRVAIACSGLGHIARGVETWAADLGSALRADGVRVTLFQGAGPEDSWRKTLSCRRRFEASTQRWVGKLRHIGGWRLGIGSGYDFEQASFVRRLWPMVRRNYDILHVQDPLIGRWMNRLHRLKLSRPRVILANGVGETAKNLRTYQYLQHLSPREMEAWSTYQRPGQKAFLIPNFVDPSAFICGDRRAARAAFGLPQNDFVVLSAAALRKQHKRVDLLIREFARFIAMPSAPQATLVLAGAREQDTDEILELGKNLLGSRVVFLENLPRERMAELYRAADIFALASTDELFGIVIAEAMATGLPVACNDTPTLRWVVGPAGQLQSIDVAGGMAAQLMSLANPQVRAQHSTAARTHLERNFATPVVIAQIRAMYAVVAAS